jgi:hypothetical protein
MHPHRTLPAIAILTAGLAVSAPAAAGSPAPGGAEASASSAAQKAAALRPGLRRDFSPRRLPPRAERRARRASKRLMRGLPPSFRPGPDSASRTFSTTYGWVSGNNVWDYGRECWDILGAGPGFNRMVSSWVSYYRSTDDVSYPRAGERFWVSILYGVTGLPCGGLIDIAPQIAAPGGSMNFAIDAQNPVRCWAKPRDKGWGEVTGQQWTVNLGSGPVSGTWCHDPAQGPNGSLMGTTLLGQGWQYEVIFPVYATRQMNGCPDKLLGQLASSNIYKEQFAGAYYPAVSDPQVCVFVASNPSWGGAPPGATSGATPGGQTGFDAPINEQPQDIWAPNLTATGASSMKMNVAFRGLDSDFECSEACNVNTVATIPRSVAKRIRLKAVRPPVTVASGQASLGEAGKGTVRAVFTRKAKARLKRLKKVKLTVTTTASDLAGNPSAPVVRTVTLRRR